jgi:hypothetical protein
MTFDENWPRWKRPGLRCGLSTFSKNSKAKALINQLSELDDLEHHHKLKSTF